MNGILDTHQRMTLKSVLMGQWQTFKQVILFSTVISVLSLSPMVFMYEVYGRVLTSQSATTLVWLLVCILGIYAIMEMLEMLRHRLLLQIGWQVDSALREWIHDTAHFVSLRTGIPSVQPLHDMRTLREFISSSATTSLIEIPASLFFLILVSFISPWLCLVSLLAALIQILIGISTDRKTMPAIAEANKASMDVQNYASEIFHHSQMIFAMGMKQDIFNRWIRKQHQFLKHQAVASDIAGSNSAISKFVLTLQGSLILGISCWLALKGMLLGGIGLMIVASTLGGRVLSPLIQLVSHWRQVVNARDAYQRLDRFMSVAPNASPHMPLPAPLGSLSVENLVAGAPGSTEMIIKGISFNLEPGETLMIIGPSAAGKSSLARVLMGVWQPMSGFVRLDSANLHTWNKEELGPYLGYLPQTVDLFDGTLAENIARFGDVDMEKVRRAVELVGLTELIESLPDGFNTLIGLDGIMLSAGERQRLGLARALYGDPKFLLLDEPNSSLDAEGEEALLNTLYELKKKRCTTIVITVRNTLLPAADKVLLLKEGRIAAYGARGEVLEALSEQKTKSLTDVSSAPKSQPFGRDAN